MTDVDDFLAGYETPCEEVPICGKPGLVAEFMLLESEIITAGAANGLAGAPKDLVDRLEQLQGQIDDSVQVFRIQARGHREWADLLAAHPPTPEERAAGHGVHYATFDVASVAASTVDPDLTHEQAERLNDTLPPSEWEALVGAVRRVHSERVAGPKSLLLSALHRQNDESSDTQAPEGSLVDPSSDASAEQ